MLRRFIMLSASVVETEVVDLRLVMRGVVDGDIEKIRR